MMRLTLVYVGEICAEAVDRFQNSLSVQHFRQLDCLHAPRFSRQALVVPAIYRLYDQHLSASTIGHFESRHSPVWSIQSLDRLGIEILNSLFVTSAHAISCAAVSIEGVNCLGYPHL